MSNVILSWVFNAKEEAKGKIIKLAFWINIPIIIGVTTITIPLTYVAMYILYRQYMGEIMVLTILVSISTAFGTASTFIKSVLLKFAKTTNMIIVYIIYFIILIVLGIELSKLYALLGFAIAIVISKMTLWISFVVLLSKNKEMVVIEK